jgi:S-adenosylmethionine-diacylglycerol 3-amino-3-carboxypropyl transferase
MKSDYFQRLNYSLGNEDSAFECGVLPPHSAHVLAIAGSGSRVIPLLSKQPEQITLVDTSPPQLYLTQLRIELLRQITLVEYLSFWEYPPYRQSGKDRKRVFETLHLSNEARLFLTGRFEAVGWNTLLYAGKWERTFRLLSRFNAMLTGKAGRRAFTYTNMNEYLAAYQREFPHRAWWWAVFLLGNTAVFNALLYNGAFPKKNIPGPLFGFYLKRFDRLFKQNLPQHNCLLQLLFFGKLVYPEGNPLECTPKVYQLAQKALAQVKLSYVLGDLIETAAKTKRQYDFVSLSDIGSYLSGERERTFLHHLRAQVMLEGLIVLRHYLRIPEQVEMAGYQDVTDNYSFEIDQEKTQMYQIQVLKAV